MLRPRFLIAAILALILFPRAGWSAGGAGGLEDLVARAKALEERGWKDELPEPEIRDLESGFISLLHQDPENRAVAAQMASFYGQWCRTLKTPAPELLDFVRTSHDPAGLAQILLEPVDESGLQAPSKAWRTLAPETATT